MYIMVQKSSYLKTLEVFFQEPITIHFIKEISKKVKIAPTSIRMNIKQLLNESLIISKKSKPFNGYIANRDNEDFIFYKRIYNFYSLKEIKDYLSKHLSPKLAVVFGSYSLGEDIEGSDIDFLILSKSKKKLDLTSFEKELKREINVIIIKDLKKLDKNIIKRVYNGFVICGGF